ncbi:MAG: hypothetical protein E7184_01730 [Erysipelotrichaceae bacterium]|nr:hypothetical protein [Erysipelotrichaceae bacterium]
MKKIVVYQKCSKYESAKKLLNENIIPLGVKVNSLEEKKEILKTGYYKELIPTIKGIEIFYDNYLVYNYHRNKELKENQCEPEIDKIIYKDENGDKRIYKNIKFDENIDKYEYLNTNVGKYNIKTNSLSVIGKHIQLRKVGKKYAPEVNLLEIKCNYKEAKAFIFEGIYPFYIDEDVKEVEGPYKKSGSGWKLDVCSDLYFEHLIKIEGEIPVFHKIEERSKGLLIIDEGRVYDLDFMINIIKTRPRKIK